METIDSYKVRMMYYVDTPDPNEGTQTGQYYIVNVMETKDYEFARFIAETVDGYIDFN